MKYSNLSVVALIPSHCREGKDVDWNKGTGSPGIAGGGVTLQRYESALPHFCHRCRGSFFLDNKVFRRRMEHTSPLGLSSRCHLQGTMYLPCQVPPALKGVRRRPWSALRANSSAFPTWGGFLHTSAKLLHYCTTTSYLLPGPTAPSPVPAASPRVLC